MKKLVSFILAAFMLIGTVPFAVSAAATFTPGNASVPFTPSAITKTFTESDKSATLTVNTAYFDQISDADLAKFVLTRDNQAAFDQNFDVSAFYRHENGTDILVTLTAKIGSVQHAGTYNLGFTYESVAASGTIPFNATIQPPPPPPPAEAVITGVNGGSAISWSKPSSMLLNETFTVTFTPQNFTWDNDSAIKKITAANVQQYFEYTPTDNLSAAWSQSGENVVLTLRAVKAGEIAVVVKPKSVYGTGPATSGSLSIRAGDSITGLNSNSAVSWSMPSSMLLNETFTVTFTPANFTWEDGNASGKKITVADVQQYFEYTPTDYLSATWTQSNNDVVLTLKAIKAGDITVTVKPKSAYGGSPARSGSLSIKAGDSLTGVNTASSISWNMPSSMKLNETFTVTFTPSNFTWEDGNASGKKITVADVQQYFEYTPTDYLSATWTQSSSNVVLTLKAIKAGDITVTVKPKSAYGGSPVRSGSLSIKAGDSLTGVNTASSISWSMPSSMKLNETFTVTFTPANFTWEDGNASGKKITVADVQQYFEYTPTANLGATWAQSGNNVVLTLKATKAGNNIAVTVKPKSAYGSSPALSGNLTINADSTTSGNKITGINSSSYLGSNMTLNGRKFTDDAEDLTIEPGSVLYLDIDSDFFTWEKGQPTTANVTTGMLSNGKIAVKVSKKTGSDIISSVTMVSEGGRARIKVEFTKNFNSFTEKKFSATVYLTVNGKRHTDSEVVISGVIQNEMQYATSGQDWYDLEDIAVIEAEDTIRSAELYVGNGVTIITTLSKNRQYYAASDTSLTNSDMQLMDRYSAIEQVINLDTKNITSNAKVKFDLGSSRYHVYDKDRKYLGTTNQQLPLSSKYYIASRQINFSVSDGSGSSIVEVPGGSSSTSSLPNDYSSAGSGSTGGTGSGSAGSGSGSNNNYNPPTGFAPVKIMVLLGVLILAGGAVVGLTGKRKN